MGLVEVTGLATGPATMIAPVTQVPCYYSRTVGWQLRQSGKNKKWEKVADEVQLTPFYLDDNTGRVLVNPENAEMDIHQDFDEQYRASLFSGCADVPSTVALFLGRHGVMLDKNVKVEEYCIKPKNALFILGTLSANEGVVARTNTSSGSVPQTSQHKISLEIPGLSAPAPVRVISGTASQHSSDYGTETKVIRITDINTSANSSNMTQQEKVAAALIKAGITNPAAWAIAGVNTSEGTSSPQNSAKRGAAIAEDSSEEFDLRPPVVLQRGKHESTFFISWRSQRDVVKSLNWKSGLMIWGGPALTLLCTYFIAAEFGWL